MALSIARSPNKVLGVAKCIVKTRTKRILLLTPLLLIVAYAATCASFRSEPSGYVHAGTIINHSHSDILEFSGGTVTLRTCCGDESWGTYTRLPDGQWIWRIQIIQTAPPVMDFLPL